MTLPVAAAVALLALSTGGASVDPDAAVGAGGVVEEGNPASDGAAAPRAARADAGPFQRDPYASRSGPRHVLALGWHGTSFFSSRGSHYVFHSAALGYLGSFGTRGPFVHATALLPLQARQDGRVYATGDYYGRRSGGDLLFGWQWRWRVQGAELEAGPGLHATLLWLPGRTGYRDFSALPMGAGAMTTVRWRGRARVLSGAMTIGAHGSVAYDFYDPLRSDDLSHGITSRAGVLVGLEGWP